VALLERLLVHLIHALLRHLAAPAVLSLLDLLADVAATDDVFDQQIAVHEGDDVGRVRGVLVDRSAVDVGGAEMISPVTGSAADGP